MGERILGTNKGKLKDNIVEPVGQCTCRKACPMNGSCKTKNTIYEAIIKTSKNETFKYIGKCSTTFIERYRNHKKAVKTRKYKIESELSKKIWDLKDNGITYDVKWNIRKICK